MAMGDADHLGVQPQRQTGLSYVGFSVPMGWLRGDQMLGLAEAAGALAADVRLTRQQNFIVGNVPDARLEELIEQVERIGFSARARRLHGRAIACTGEPFCNYAVSDTKHKLAEILTQLERRFGARADALRIHLDGCPHACGQHFVGDINLTGTTVRLPTGGSVQGYDILLHGGLGARAAIARPVLRRIPTGDVIACLERLIAAWIEAADGAAETGSAPLSFRDFCDAHTDDQLRTIAASDAEGLCASPAACGSEGNGA